MRLAGGADDTNDTLPLFSGGALAVSVVGSDSLPHTSQLCFALDQRLDMGSWACTAAGGAGSADIRLGQLTHGWHVLHAQLRPTAATSTTSSYAMRIALYTELPFFCVVHDRLHGPIVHPVRSAAVPIRSLRDVLAAPLLPVRTHMLAPPATQPAAGPPIQLLNEELCGTSTVVWRCDHGGAAPPAAAATVVPRRLRTADLLVQRPPQRAFTEEPSYWLEVRGATVTPNGVLLVGHVVAGGDDSTGAGWRLELGYGCMGDKGRSKSAVLARDGVPLEVDRLVVLSQYWGENVFHFMLEVLPRLILLPKDALLAAPGVRVHVNAPVGFVRELLALLGIAPSRLVWGNTRARLAYMPQPNSCAHLDRRLGNGLRTWLRAALAPQPLRRRQQQQQQKQAVDVVLLKRSGTRRLEQHDKLSIALQTAGFMGGVAVLDDKHLPPLADTLALFSRARVVIGVHGAGLSNMLACQAGTGVVELLPHDTLPTCYARAAAALNLRYAGFVPQEASFHGVFRLTAAELGVVVRTARVLAMQSQI